MAQDARADVRPERSVVWLAPPHPDRTGDAEFISGPAEGRTRWHRPCDPTPPPKRGEVRKAASAFAILAASLLLLGITSPAIAQTPPSSVDLRILAINDF